MLPLQHIFRPRSALPFGRRALLAISFFTLSVSLAACASGGGGGSSTPPPPLAITVSVTPGSGTVLLGNALSFSATVTNTTNTSVTWSVNGTSGGSTQLGTISSSGLYTAPADLPTPSTIQVTATSVADPTKSSSASVTISSDIAVSISPVSSSLELGAAQSFQASIASSGHPDPTIRWSLSGPNCPAACGSIDANGNYTAPAILPSSPAINIVATSAADSTKQSSASVTITSHFTLQLTAPSTLSANATAAIVVTLTPVPGSRPSSSLAWSVSGAGCAGSACGILSVITTQSATSGAISNTATYTAPSAPPQPASIVITVTPLADTSKQAQATIIIQSGPLLGLSPVTATLAANHRVTLTVAETPAVPNDTFSWRVNGIAGGNSTFGQICVVASSPCQAVTSGAPTQVDFIAPGAIPSPNPVPVQVASNSNPSLTASAQVTILNHVLVSVLPNNVTLPPLAVQGFTATVLGTSNQSVVWQIEGTTCSKSGACGSITQSGAYTAPAAAPSPDTIQIVATSEDDSAQSATANVTISSGANILSLHPASVYAGAADGFTLAVDGTGFVLSTSGSGSTLLINGSARVTTCSAVTSCTAPVITIDVAQPGTLSVQIQNPDNTKSNSVSLIVVAPNTSDATITLTTSTPTATGQDITVVEPTTAGLDSSTFSLDINVAALGLFNVSTNNCNLAGNPLPLPRPTSGTSTADICLFSESGFDTSMIYTVSGPGDVSVISKQPAGLGIIHLTLQIPASAMPGARTLFIQTTNLDETSASGVLDIQ